MEKFDNNYFNKCYRLQCAGWQIYEYFYKKGYFEGQLFRLNEFAEHFWNKDNNFLCTNYLPWRWEYTDEEGFKYNEKDMLNLIGQFVW